MKIFLKSGGMLREKLNPDVDHYTRSVQADDGSSLAEILSSLKVDSGLVAFAYSGGELRRLDYCPVDGEVITLQPPVSGG